MVELGSRQCASGLCLVNHFRGRVTCPYGQPDAQETSPDARCAVPPSGTPVSVGVNPQHTIRRSADSVYCSCRCAGPGPGPFCQCPEGYSCTPLVDDLKLSGSGSVIAGSYCTKQGYEFFNVLETRGAPSCNYDTRNCE